MNKTCPKCKQLKDVSEFYRHSRGKDGLYIYCKECKLKIDHDYRKAHAHYRNKKNKLYQQKLKIEAVMAYGGKCECCGEENIEFLTIDHINNNGGLERREYLKKGIVFSGPKLYLTLKKKSYPNSYRVLCWNCNCSRGVHGYCPHKTAKNERTHLDKDSIQKKFHLFT